MLCRTVNQIDPASSKPQSLINWDGRTYNFDVIDGVNHHRRHQPRDGECQMIHPQAER